MTESVNGVISSSVTYAVRNTNVDGFKLKEGDIIGLTDKNILAKGESVAETVEKLIEKQIDENIVNITMFYGEGVSDEDAEKLCQKLQGKYPNYEISCLNGGQPVYYYIISMQ
jgi:hypothetical protein